MTCGHCQGATKVFGRGRARRELRRLRRKGPGAPTRLLIEGLSAGGVQGLTHLDIGGGVGVVAHTLLERGTRLASGVDASPEYVAVAEEDARLRGLESRVRHEIGDFLDRAPHIPPADLVSLDKVLCCYPDMRGLARAAAERATRRLGLVYPVDRWWTRLLLRVPNLWFRLVRNPFRVYVHDSLDVLRTVREAGLERISQTRSGLWWVEVYERDS